MAKSRAASTGNAATAADATFIFRGTVQKTNASTAPDVKANARTAIVRVDEVLAAPPALARIAGREVTVIIEGASRTPKQNEQAVFHATGVSFGDDIAVRATATEPTVSAARLGMGGARAAAAPLAAPTAVNPVREHRDLVLKRSLDRADVVLTGTVTEVRTAPEADANTNQPRLASGARAAMSRRRAAAPSMGQPSAPQRISEHDPIWHEAVVTVDSVEKGVTTQKQVRVRFPSSYDVRWRHYPKYQVGQQGVFLLSKGEAEAPAGRAPRRAALARGGARAMRAMPVPTTPTAMQATAALQPDQIEIERVRQLLNTPAAGIVSGLTPASARATASRATRRTAKRAATGRKTRRASARRHK